MRPPFLPAATLVLLLAAGPADGLVQLPSLLGPNRALPIVIVSDAGFLLPPDVSGVRSGNGWLLDPYIIEGWTIASLPTNPTPGSLGYSNVWLPCIYLANTDAHAVIRDNAVRGNNCHGIWLQNASNVRVERNILTHNTGHGILVESLGPPDLGHHGRNIVVRDNFVKGNGFDGVRVFHASQVAVERNSLVANANFGLLARAVLGLVVEGNLAEWNDVAGLFVEMSPGARIEGNAARHSPTGIDLEFSDDGVIRGNTAEDNRDLGIYTSEMSSRTLVEGNLVQRNGLDSEGWDDGIALNGLDEVARGNLVLGNRDGIASRDASARIEGNLLRANARGIVLEACASKVQDNGVYGNGVGVRVAEGDCAGLRGNNLAGNRVGALAEPGASADMALHWWGSALGPRAPGNPGGDGDLVEGDVAYAPWLAEPNPSAPSP